jgi:hypothetical protein
MGRVSIDSGKSTRLQMMSCIKVCTDFKILEVKVPIIFSGTQGFPLRRDGRYCTIYKVPNCCWCSWLGSLSANSKQSTIILSTMPLIPKGSTIPLYFL